MMVTVILSILVLAVRPSFNKYLANKHSVAAAADVVRLGRRARADSLGLERAHLLYFQPTAGGQQPFGTVSLLRGNAMHCDHEDWAPHLAQCAFAVSQPPGSACADQLDLSHAHWYHRPHALVLRNVRAGDELNSDTYLTLAPPAGNSVRALCYDAFGRVFWSTSAVGPGMVFNTTNDNNFSGAFTFVLGLLDDDSGTRRYPGMVLSFPLGGNPRRLR